MTQLKSKNLGSAKEGVHHWQAQRVTAIALAALSIFFVFLMMSLIGLDYDNAVARLASPVSAITIILFIIAAFYHAGLGLQVVIEDYVSNHSRRVASIIAMKLFVVLLAASALVSMIIILIKAYS